MPGLEPGIQISMQDKLFMAASCAEKPIHRTAVEKRI
jgi:hypothetical protein